MPDKRTHRGKHPEDDRAFSSQYLPALESAVEHLSWLLTHEYALISALKLVGDRFSLTARQRMAVRRCACSDQALASRLEKAASVYECRGKTVEIDGYNLLITVESALSGAVIVIGRDGCYRDLASIHSTYRKVEETAPALELIASALGQLQVDHVNWYLDKPVSNSGRLRRFMLEQLDRISPTGRWNIEVVEQPDKQLRESQELVVSADSVVIDHCARWANLAAHIVSNHLPGAWVVDLSGSRSATGQSGT